MTDIFVESWGTGTPVVLVHGSLAIGAEEWQAQRPLAEGGYRLLVLDRRGYGRSPTIKPTAAAMTGSFHHAVP
jgi:pimeloyl-ACP methyl ester carboxylesterase